MTTSNNMGGVIIPLSNPDASSSSSNVLIHPTRTSPLPPYSPHDDLLHPPSIPSPHALVPEFDVIHELTYARELYYGETENTVHLTALPIYIESCVNRLGVRIPTRGSRTPSTSLVASCCISNGVQALASNTHLRDFTRIRNRLLNMTNVRAHYFDIINLWFKNFRISFPDMRAGGRTKVSVLLPVDVKNDIVDLKSRYGSSMSMWGSIALVTTLAQQDSDGVLLTDHRDDLLRTVDVFNRVLEMRYEMAKGVMRVFTEEQGPGSGLSGPNSPSGGIRVTRRRR